MVVSVRRHIVSDQPAAIRGERHATSLPGHYRRWSPQRPRGYPRGRIFIISRGIECQPFNGPFGNLGPLIGAGQPGFPLFGVRDVDPFVNHLLFLLVDSRARARQVPRPGRFIFVNPASFSLSCFVRFLLMAQFVFRIIKCVWVFYGRRRCRVIQCAGLCLTRIDVHRPDRKTDS